MTSDEAATLVRELIAEHAGTEPSAVKPGMRVAEDLGLDSVDAVEMLIRLEDRTGVRFEVDELTDIVTVDDILEVLLAAQDAAVRPDQGLQS